MVGNGRERLEMLGNGFENVPEVVWTFLGMLLEIFPDLCTEIAGNKVP